MIENNSCFVKARLSRSILATASISLSSSCVFFCQQQLSDKLKTLAIYICRDSISRIEDGSRTVTDIELFGLSQVLATPVENFFPQK